MRYLIFFFVLFSSYSYSTEPMYPSCGGQYITGCGYTGNLPTGACGLAEKPRQYVWSTYGCAAGQKRVWCGSGCTCPSNKILQNGYCVCSGTDIWYDAASVCGPKTCPAGQHLNTRTTGATSVVECIADSSGDGPPSSDNCPSGFPKVDGQCPVCVNGYNPNGTCSDGCPAGKTKQGEINGQPICVGSCVAPQVWGSVNGVEGCYGAQSCPNGGSYGSVNGVPGCYGGGSGSGSGSGSSAGGGASSVGGSGGSAGGGTNASSGSGGSGGSGGGNSGGGSIPQNNNSMGQSFPDGTQCPLGFVKDGNYCVSPDRGDCIVGYHSVVVSSSPLVFICTPDNPPPASSAPASSSPPISSAQSSQQSSPQSSAASSAASGSSGSAASSGSGSGGSGGSAGGSNASSGNNSSQGAGECDPTAKSYDECMGRYKTPTQSDRDGIFTDADQKNTKSLIDYEKAIADDISRAQSGISFQNAPDQLQNAISPYLPSPSSCSPMTFEVLSYHIVLQCAYFEYFKSAMAWFLSMLLMFDLYRLATRPVER